MTTVFFTYIFYTDGTKGGTPEVKAMLNYFKQSTQNNAIDGSTKKIHDYIEKVKINQK